MASTKELLSQLYELSNELFEETKNFMDVVQESPEDERNSNEKIYQNIKYLSETTLLVGIGGKLEDDDFERERKQLNKEAINEDKGTGRARPEMFMLDDDEDEEESSDDEIAKTKKDTKESTEIKAPLPKYGNIREEVEEKQRQEKLKKLNKVKRRALKSSLINELRAELNDAPEEEHEEIFGKPKETMLKKERQKYEEDYLLRLNKTKKEKTMDNKKRYVNELDNLLNFGKYMVDEENDVDEPLNDKKASGPKNNYMKRRKLDKKSQDTDTKKKPNPKKFKNRRR